MICQECTEAFVPKRSDARFCPICRETRIGQHWTQDPRWRLSKLLAATRNRSKTKILSNDLDLDFLTELWAKNEGRCVLTGKLFNLSAWGSGRVHPDTPSIDRIIPSLGYVKGNVRLITYHMNMALSEFGTDRFEELAKAYLNNGAAA